MSDMGSLNNIILRQGRSRILLLKVYTTHNTKTVCCKECFSVVEYYFSGLLDQLVWVAGFLSVYC